MKSRVIVLCSVSLIAIVGLFLTVPRDPQLEAQTRNTSVPQPTVIPITDDTQNKKLVTIHAGSDSDKTRQSNWKPPRSGVLTGIIVEEALGPRSRAIIVEANGTRFFVPHYIVKSSNQSDAEYFSLLREYPGKVTGDLTVGTRVRVTYKDCSNSDRKDADWSLAATRLVEIKSPR